MNRQKSFNNDNSTLYLVATPIGNLEELTQRAQSILRSVDIIAAEDTRNTGILLSHFDIKTKMIAHHLHNEQTSTIGIINLLKEGKNVALVSDAGYPLINDPGENLVKKVTEEGFNVVPVSGASAFINALVASGLSTNEFIYIGFLPANDKEFKEKINEIKSYKQTLIFYEAPHRIKKTLEKLLNLLGDRQICLARELTKIHEEFLRGTISEILDVVDELKGEMVIIVEGNQEKEEINQEEINNEIEKMIKNKVSVSEAIKIVAKQYGVSKNKIYQQYHQKEGK